MSRPLRLVVAAGGTGGHVMPALSAARAVLARRPGSEALFVGVGRPAEADILGPELWPRLILAVSGLKGRRPTAWPKVMWQAFRGLARSMELMRSFRPDVCLGVGGYVTGPVGLAAWLAGVPLALHEQNSRPGLANRWLGRLADAVMLGFPAAATAFPAGRTTVAGNPVREEIAAAGLSRRDFGRRPATLLILGGSQGSSRLNQAAISLAASLKARGVEFSIIHQSGAAQLEQSRQAYAELGVEARVEAFYRDMAAVYREAHLALARAGALTTAELAAARLPAIMTPLPTAADDHQTLNARFLAERGAARLIPEAELDVRLVPTVVELLERPELLAAMEAAGAAAGVLVDRGGDRMAEVLLRLADGRAAAESAAKSAAASRAETRIGSGGPDARPEE